MFKIAKDSANKARTQAINQLRAVLVRAEPQLRESLTGLGPVTLFRACANLPNTVTTTTGAATVIVLRGLARRILALTDEVKALNNQITAALKVCAPKLLDPSRCRSRHRRRAAHHRRRHSPAPPRSRPSAA